MVVDAVPLLPETFYVGADTVVLWLVEGNVKPLANGMTYWGLKKVDLTNMKEVIASINANSGDTMKVAEQQRLVGVIQRDVDPLFKSKPTYYIVPQDSAMQKTGYHNAINHFKDGRVSNGTRASWDDNHDGIIDGGEAKYNFIIYVVSPGDTLYKDIVIKREDFKARLFPNEVGFDSKIQPSKTISHIYTTVSKPTPADAWFAKLAEHYPGKTQHTDILSVNELTPIYNKLKKN